MAKKKSANHKEEINQILIDELDIERDEDLLPSTRIEPADDEDLLVHYILIRIEEQLELAIPAEAAAKIHTVQDVYKLIASLQAK